MSCNKEDVISVSISMPDGRLCPELMTEDELITFLRIPQISSSTDFHNVIENLKRIHNLPRIHICGKPLYPAKAILSWVIQNTVIPK